MVSVLRCISIGPLGQMLRLIPITSLKQRTLLDISLIKQQALGKIEFIHHTSSSSYQSVIAVESSPQDEELDKLYKLLEVEVRGNDKAVLKSYTQFATTAADHLGIQIGKCWAPTKAHHERFTVLKSIHVNKKNMVQYEFRTYFRFMQFHKLTGSTADTFLEYIQRNLPEGVAMKVTKVGLEKIPDHLKKPKMLLESSDNLKQN